MHFRKDSSLENAHAQFGSISATRDFWSPLECLYKEAVTTRVSSFLGLRNDFVMPFIHNLIDMAIPNENADATRLSILNRREKEALGTLASLRSRISRKIKSLMGSEEEYRFQTFELKEMEPLCSEEEIRDIQEYVERVREESAPEWATIASFLIDDKGKIGTFITKIPSQHHPLSQLLH